MGSFSVKTNLTSMMARRNLSSANTSLRSNIEHLSTGERINEASDDAAGLAVSEQMEADIRSLAEAQRNANDGVSMLQTAEGSLSQVHDMLGRMKELATQANSDSISESARKDIDEEFTQLANEIDDVAEGTNFNSVDLLDGSFTGKTLQVGLSAGDTLEINISQNFGSKFLGKEIASVAGVAAVNSQGGGGNDHRIEFNDSTTDEKFTTGEEVTIESTSGSLTVLSVVGVDGANDTVTFAASDGTFDAGDSTSGFNFVAGVGPASVDTREHASFAAAAVNDAIDRVSRERSKMGANLNRLDEKLDNIKNVKQNLEASNSRIRDVNVAKETAELSKNRILTQAGTTMLSQANQRPQSLLQILGG